MTGLSSFLMALAGFAALSLSMQRHARQAEVPAWLPRPGLLRWTGWAFLALSVLIRLPTPAWRIGIVEWVGELGLAALVVVLTLFYRPRFLPVVPTAAVLLALIAIIAGQH
jgi:hypothetical protein